MRLACNLEASPLAGKEGCVSDFVAWTAVPGKGSSSFSATAVTSSALLSSWAVDCLMLVEI